MNDDFEFEKDDTKATITLTIDGDQISLDDSDDENIIGLFNADEEDDYGYCGIGDYETEFTPVADYAAPAETLVTLPEGAEAAQWYSEGTGTKEWSDFDITGTAQVFIDGSEVYVSGIFSDVEDGWMKGTLDDGVVTFDSRQYLGDSHWALGSNGPAVLDHFTMTYDEEAATLTLSTQVKASSSPYALYGAEETVKKLILMQNEPEEPFVDELPYSNSFDTEEEQKMFTVIDANDDGTTWQTVAQAWQISTQTSGSDDWLVSPKVFLNKGKRYHFSMTVRNGAQVAVKFEVKAATEKSADALSAGTQVVEMTEFKATMNPYVNTKTIEGEFTVDDYDFYYIGIHSANDGYANTTLTVDDFSLEAMPATVPYEADFSTANPMDDFVVINNNEDGSTWDWSATSGAYYSYDSDNAADDYLVLPIMLEAGKNYEVTVNAASWNYPEEFEVVAGTECSAEGLTTTVIGKTTPPDDPTDFSGIFTPETSGLHYVAIHATSAADLYLLSVYRFTIDVAPAATAPAAVSDLTVEPVASELKANVKFTAPTTAVDGSELTEAITSIVVLRNGEVAKTFENVAVGSELQYVDEVPAEGFYTYQVIPANASGEGRKSDKVSVKVVLPQDVPYVVNFTDEDAFNFFEVIDNNGDGSTWDYSSYNEAARYSYNWDNDADDYLVSKPLNLVAGKKYMVNVRAMNDNSPERFEVLVGTSVDAEAFTITAIEPTDVTTSAYCDFEGSFTVEESGIYYVAIHAISFSNMYELYVSSLSVELGPEPDAPAAPDVVATAGAAGALTATIEVTAPDKTVDGNALTAVSKLELYRDGALMAEQADVAPGGVVTFTDADIETSGLYAYQAVAYNESGKGEKSVAVKVYVGLDQPAAPEQVNAVDHATSIDFSWTAVNTGLNGGYVNPANINYDIWKLQVSPFYVFFDEKLASVTGETSVTADYGVDEGDVQDYTYFAVRTTNEATVDEDQADWNYTAVFTGKPYDAVVEGFADEALHYYWNTNAQLLVTGYSSDEDGVALALLSDEAGQKVLISGKLNLKDAAHPMLVFDALNASNISSLYVMGSTDQGQWNLLQTVQLSDTGYQTYQIPLNSLQDYERYAQIAFVANYTNTMVADEEGNIIEPGDMFFLDNIRIGDFLDNDLAVIASAPTTVALGTTASVDVIVENAGLKTASNYTVKVLAGEKELLSETVSDELAPFAKKQFTAQLATTVFDEAGDVQVTVSVDYADDQNTDNNTITGTVTIEEPNVAAPQNLVAEDKGGAGVSLKWTAPESAAEAVTEDFESGPGEFTQIDGNGDGEGWVYMSDNDELASHSGSCGMQSYSYVPGVGAVQVDNWLVTPRAILDGTFSFWAAAQDDDWTDEHFAVYVSTTGNQSVDDFVQVSEEFVANGYTTEYTVDLSSYAGQEGYIAIRHFNSYDQFALVVDDISFTKAPVTPIKYNIYYEGVLVASVEADQTTYTVAAELLDAGEKTFAVTAVYANGQESRPATATIDVTTDIRQITADGNPVDIYSLDGKLVRRQATSLSGLKGAYVVGGKTILVK